MSVLVSTAYMDEAERFDWLIAMDAGRILAMGTPEELKRRTGTENLEETFVALLPEGKRGAGTPVDHPPARRDRRRAGHRGQEPDAPVREVYRRSTR